MPDGICPFAEFIPGVTTFSKGHVDRVGFCDHTAGGFLSTMRSASFWNGQGVSTHAAIGRKGQLVQLVNIFDTAFAQGRLGPSVNWPPYAAMGKQNPNGYLISAEHEDAETVNGGTVYVPNAAWTPEQYATDLKWKRWCIAEVKRVTGKDLLRFGIDSLAGHHMFDSVNRAQCPGPAWRNEYRARLYADLTGDDDMFTRWNLEANPSYWSGKPLSGPSGFGIRSDFNLPAEARSVELEVFLKAGRVTVMDGESSGRAGYIEGPGFGRVRVFIGPKDGNAWFEAAPGTVIDKLVCLGYYTS